MRAVRFVDVPVSENRDIIFEVAQRIIGVSVANQGTNDVNIAMGNQNAFKTLEAGADTEYGNIAGGSEVFYLTGNLKIEAPGITDGTAWGANYSVVVTLAYDVTDQIENDC